METSPLYLTALKDFFRTGATRPLDVRVVQLKKLKKVIQANEEILLASLFLDLGKSEAEAFLGEIAFVYEEIEFAVKNLKKWARPKRVQTPFTQFPGRSIVYAEPKGVVFIIGPWNYPFQLLIAPLVGALAAGNCALLKPSEMAPHTAKVICKIIFEAFDKNYVSIIEGGVEATTALLKEPWDHIFFTGSTAVGKIVMAEAAKQLIPVTLELGGKSPCIVDKSADLDVAARRIVWGKFFNAGQTCVAPDYLLVPKGTMDDFIGRLVNSIEEFYGSDPQASPDYGRIVNSQHYTRLNELLRHTVKVYGAVNNGATRYLSPTLVKNISWTHPLMENEIFGPILPILEYNNLEEVIALVNSLPKPLALYFFSSDLSNQKRLLNEISFGGGCINDTLVHLANPKLPFGGVGASGIGAYHGKYSFDTFTHQKSIVHRSFWLDLKLRYPPYKEKIKILRRVFR